ncbi:MAG: GNAT family N-acetyltransferase [Bacteriovoracaceae bacterium]|nr:GNAT family N-acetyltransferase [Bacteriovoracaceae bacterium]
MDIKRAVEYKYDQEDIEKIFFDNSLIKTFSSHTDREDFFNRWCGQYLKNYPTQFYLAIIDNKVVGYLAGHTNSKTALKEFKIPGYDLFQEFYEEYPAHLHINCDLEYQGLGIGTKLMKAFMDEMKEKELPGLHIITSIGAKNSGFYASLGFNILDFKNLKNSKLLIMGKKL